jgi:transposase
MRPRCRRNWRAAALLREYKGQTSVEQRFHFLKDPAFVDAVFLQKP